MDLTRLSDDQLQRLASGEALLRILLTSLLPPELPADVEPAPRPGEPPQ